MRPAWLLFAGLAAALGNAGTASVGAPAEVEIRLTDHRPGIADFTRLMVGLKSLSLHARGRSRGEGWHALGGEVPPIDIVPLKNGRYETIATREVPAGRYDAVRIRFSSVDGELRSGKAPALVARDTMIAVDVELRSEHRTSITVDLYAENQTDHEPQRYVVKVKDVRTGQ